MYTLRQPVRHMLKVPIRFASVEKAARKKGEKKKHPSIRRFLLTWLAPNTAYLWLHLAALSIAVREKKKVWIFLTPACR